MGVENESLWQELKKRRVVRVAVAYAVVAYAVVEAAGAFFPPLHLPEWTTTFVAALAVLGFPVAIVLAWVFQITPEGLTRARSPASATGFWTAGRIAVVGAVVVLGGVAGAFLFQPRGAKLDRNRVVVATFENRSGDAALAAVGSMAADWLTQGMIQASLGEVVDRGGLSGEAGTSAPGAATPLALARATGAGTVIAGAYYKQADSLYIRAQLLDANSGDIISSLEPVSAPATAPVKAVEQLRARVLSAVATALSVPSPNTVGLAGRPPTYEAYRAFEDGNQAAAPADKLVHYRRAIVLDSTFNLARIAQLHEYAMNRDDMRVDSVILVLEETRDRLTPLERALFDRQRGFAREDVHATYEAAKRISALAPSRTAALEALRVNRPREAIAEAKHVHPAVRAVDWNAYYGVVAAAHHMLGEHRNELRVVRRGAKDFPTHPERFKAHVRALAALHQPEEALARVEETASLPVADVIGPSVGGSGGGGFLLTAALELRAHGHAAAADSVLARLIRVLETLPEAWRAAPTVRRERASAHSFAGRDQEARAILDSLRAELPAPVNGSALGGLAVLAARRGDRAEAERISALLEQPPFSTMTVLGRRTPQLWRARIAALLGQNEKALSLLRDAVRFAIVQTGDGAYAHVDPDLASLRGWKPFDDLMRPKD